MNPLMPSILKQSITLAGSFATGGKITGQIPTGPSYRKTTLRFTKAAGLSTAAEIAAQVARVRLVFGSETVADLTAEELQKVGAHYGLDSLAGYLEIPHFLHFLDNQAQRDVSTIGTADIKQIQAEVTFGTIPGDATAITGCKVVSEAVPERRPMGAYVSFRSNNRTFASAAAETITDLDVNVTDAGTLAHFFFKTGATISITNLRQEVESFVTMDDVDKNALDMLNKRAGRTVQSDVVAIDYALGNSLGQVLRHGIRSFKVIPTFGSAPNTYSIIEARLNRLGAANALKK